MAYAVVRIRGTAQVGKRVKDTLSQLHLCKINHMVLLPENKSATGMLEKVKDYITWGEVSPEIIAKVLLNRAEPIGGTAGISDEFISQNNSGGYSSIFSFAKAVSGNEARLSDIENMQPVIRLHPPKGGYRNIKRHFSMGGSLGYRGKAIEKLLLRMMSEEKEKTG